MSTGVRYHSTRDPQRRPADFDSALRSGLAPDGGLYVPERVPPLEADWRQAEDLPALLDAVLRPWFAPGEADERVADACEALDFPLPVRALGEREALLELHHGPTLAFKDVAARTMARWLTRSLLRRGERATVLVATSGDTGGAVADGFAGSEALRVVVLYPAGRVSPVQERQLTQPRAGVYTLAIDGDFDSCQRLVKAALVDQALAPLRLSSANSINVGRLLPQASYHLWGALQLARLRDVRLEDVVNVVPSGNLGNLVAGLLVAAMGAPLRGFVAAHNANDHVPRFLRGAAEPDERRATVATLSNAMDVGVPSNLERLLALFPGGRYPRPLAGASVDDEATLARMRRVWDEHGVLVCPHTAVGLEAWARLGGERPGWDGAHGLVFATAHAAKFPEVVARALPGVPATHPALEALPAARPDARLGADEAALRSWLIDQLRA